MLVLLCPIALQAALATPEKEVVEALPVGKLDYVAPSGMEAFWTSFKLAFALPWRRFKNDSVLVIKARQRLAK